MDEYIESYQLSKLAGVQHRSTIRLIRKYQKELEVLGKVYLRFKKNKSGQWSQSCKLNKAQVSFLSSRMNRKANISNVIKNFDISTFIITIRKEVNFFKRLSFVVSAFDNGLSLVNDYKIGNARVDIALFVGEQTLENLWLIIEYDENSHKYQTKEDDIRSHEIFKYISDNVGYLESLYIIRIKEGEEDKGIGDIVRFLNSSALQLGSSDLSPLKKYKLEVKAVSI